MSCATVPPDSQRWRRGTDLEPSPAGAKSCGTPTLDGSVRCFAEIPGWRKSAIFRPPRGGRGPSAAQPVPGRCRCALEAQAGCSSANALAGRQREFQQLPAHYHLSPRLRRRMLMIPRSPCPTMARQGLRPGPATEVRTMARGSAVAQSTGTYVRVPGMSRVQHLRRAVATQALCVAARLPHRVLPSEYAPLVATGPRLTFRPPGDRDKHATQ